MLAKWTKILPYFIVEWYAKKHCERMTLKMVDGEAIVVNPYSHTIIAIETFTKSKTE